MENQELIIQQLEEKVANLEKKVADLDKRLIQQERHTHPDYIPLSERRM